MFVKKVSAKELRDFHGKSKRVADLISNSPQEAPSPSKNSPNTPFQNAEVKRPRLEVSSSLPAKVSSSPPAKVSSSPPAKVSSSPPAKVSSSPPANVSSSPPANVSSSPLAKVSSSPPAKVSSSPPAKVSSSPPAKVSSSPSANVSSSPPANVSSSPPAKVSSSPHVQVSSSPPAKVSSSPPAKVSSSPPVQVSSSPFVQNLRNNQPSSSEGVDEMWKSFVSNTTSSGDGDAASIWDEHFPLGDLIDKHFMQENLNKKVNELELEKVLQTSLTDSIRSSFVLRVLGLKFGATEKKNKTYAAENSELKKKLSENEKNYVGEINELKKKLSEYEKKVAETASLKAELNKQKKSLEKSSLENTRLVGREKDLMEENSKIRGKLMIKEEAHKFMVEKKNAEIEELKRENELQYKAGHDRAVKQFVFFASGLKP